MTADGISIIQDMRTRMERVYKAWDDAVEAADISSLVNLYAIDGEVGSPLVYEFTRSKSGVLRGRFALRAFYEEVTRSRHDIIGLRHHDNYIARGRTICWEYPGARATAAETEGELVEAWSFNDRYQIQSHRVYWGWSRIAALCRASVGRIHEQAG